MLLIIIQADIELLMLAICINIGIFTNVKYTVGINR